MLGRLLKWFRNLGHPVRGVSPEHDEEMRQAEDSPVFGRHPSGYGTPAGYFEEDPKKPRA
jgi:hypothetical protein